MPQLRIMGDDPEHVDRVLGILLPLLAASPDLVVGDPTRLRHRSGGGRIVLDVSARRPGPIRAQAERVDTSPSPPGATPSLVDRPRQRPAVPPGRQ